MNISSPNTTGLTSLQRGDSLRNIVMPLVQERVRLANGREPKPLLVKISPDLSVDDLKSAVEATLDSGADGIIATNTTTDTALRPERARKLEGGMSGRLLHAVAAVRRNVPKDFFIIGVGGIFTGDDAWAMIQAGANAVQMYTGIVYRGPGVVKEVNRSLARKLAAAKIEAITEAVGGTHG